MGPGTLALVATLSMVVAPNPKLTACRLFAPGAACPSSRLVFRLPVDLKAPDAQQFVIVLHDVPEPTDCKMVKRVDPAFKSAMPVVTPDPKLALPMKIVPVPSCDPKRR
jgi:hypothetical protein